MSRRTVLLALAGLRGLLSLVALPLAPALLRHLLLAGGFLWREGDVALHAIVPAAVPLGLFGVWLFYALGREMDGPLPKWAARILPDKRIKPLCGVLEHKGTAVVLLGRLAAFPSTMLAAAAGSAGLEPPRFLRADGVGFALSVAEVVGAGYAFGAAYKRAGPWLTGVGVAVLFGLMFIVGRWLKSPSGASARTA